MDAKIRARHHRRLRAGAQPRDEPFASESPVVLAEIALQEGGAMLARVVSTEAGAIASGVAVELLALPEAARHPLPTFRVSQP